MDLKTFNDAGLILTELNTTIKYINEIGARKNNKFLHISLYTKDKGDSFIPELICDDAAITEKVKHFLIKELENKKARLEKDFAEF